jgi:sulfur carrier protein
VIQLQVNGDPMEIKEETSVKELVESLKLKPELVVVELNEAILKRDELVSTQLHAGDKVEIVHFVGGGGE